jgi:phospholipid transport system substrate-binding protein
MIMTARIIQVGLLSALLALLSLVAHAALAETNAGEDPQRLVAETIDQLVDRLKANSERIHQDSSIAYQISDELVAPHIDFPRVTRLVIGKYWQSASEQQRQALIAEVQSLLIR